MFSRRTKCLSIFLFLIACVWTTLGLFSVGYISTVNVNVLQGDDHGTKEGKKFSDQLPQLLNQQNILKSSTSKQVSQALV